MNPVEDAKEIFLKGVERVDPRRLLDYALSLEGNDLAVRHAEGSFHYDLALYRHLVVVGMGKASAVLAKGLEGLLGDRIEEGFVVVKHLAGVSCERIRLAEAGHPLPDERSAEAGRRVLTLAEKVRGWEAAAEPTLVVVLISGGGSALLSAPAAGISLADKAATTKLLLASGATIQEMNAVRKHLSAVKGGRLAEAFAPAAVLSLILSDVIGDDLDAIASGPTVPDSSTWETAQKVLLDRGVWGELPESVLGIFEEGMAGIRPDTPKPGSPVFHSARSVFVGNNMLALKMAEETARELGYNTLLLTSRLVGEAREIAKVFVALAGDLAQHGIPLRRPACVLTGGETTVTLKGRGLGGRNQEMALAVLAALNPSNPGHGEMIFLSAGSDGNDGPTDAAGAFASLALMEKAKTLGIDPKAFLADNDSYRFFEKTGGLFKTGSTGTNVCDMQILILP
ncbi:MAG TPA: glycerate kinase [Spirochaetaceae bacterium]|nr:glycerate kinase [Spirochaetaceae bacterium]